MLFPAGLAPVVQHGTDVSPFQAFEGRWGFCGEVGLKLAMRVDWRVGFGALPSDSEGGIA